jgi:hypothetical protein
MNPEHHIPRRLTEAHQYIEKKIADKKRLESKHGDRFTPPSAFFDYCFSLQSRLEKENGSVDYHDYSHKLWAEFAPILTIDDRNSEQLFEDYVITGLHNIDMSQLVHSSVLETMPDLVEKYHQKVASVAVWSTGDVRGTGYQIAKIIGSGVIQQFMETLHKVSHEDAAAEFIREKTSFIVDDNKISRLKEHVDEKLAKNGNEPIRLVIIEDSAGNFTKAEKALESEISSGLVTLTPIWFIDSREGITAEEKVRKLEDEQHPEAKMHRFELEEKKKKLNSISTFAHLLDERFEQELTGSHVLIDFDGVIGKNIEMRQEQAKTKYFAFLSAASATTGKSLEELDQTFTSALSGAGK